MNLRDYRRSNHVRAVSLTPDKGVLAALHALLEARPAQEREAAGTVLVTELCRQVGSTTPRLVVLDTPRPHRMHEGRLSYQKLATYSVRTRTIRVHNLTARRAQVVASRTFLETLLHELMHHWDAELLKLRRSLHTSGFYHRLGNLKRLLLAADAARGVV
jgi:hypothetical protein